MRDDRRCRDEIVLEHKRRTDAHYARALVVGARGLSPLVGRLSDPELARVAARNALLGAEDVQACIFAVDSCGSALIDMFGPRRGAVWPWQLALPPADVRDGAA
jgi:hypothetical protein